MMPQRFMSKLGTHRVQFQDRTITVKVVSEAAVVSPYLAELKSLITKSTAVGLTVGYVGRSIFTGFQYPSMLQLCVGTQCLLIQLRRSDSIPECLKQFLADPEICFVGTGTHFARRMLETCCKIELRNGIDVSDLASKVLKESLIGCGSGLKEIATVVGVSLPEYPGSDYGIDFEAKFYTDDKIKRIIYDVYGAHLIGTKLLGLLQGQPRGEPSKPSGLGNTTPRGNQKKMRLQSI